MGEQGAGFRAQGTGFRAQDADGGQAQKTEPWMRGTHPELDPLRRGVVHALEQAMEDAERWCAGLSEDAMFARLDAPPVAFHVRHMARSLDRLLTYAEGRSLDAEQIEKLGSEMAPGTCAEVMREFREGVAAAMVRVRGVDPSSYGEARGIGRKQLPTTVAGLLIHCAEHTARHTGQMVTTVKFVRALEGRL